MKLITKLWILAGAVLVVAVTTAGVISKKEARGKKAEFEHQLGLARAEGIPTSAAEFAARIPPVAEKDNAAPLYKKLAALKIESPVMDPCNAVLFRDDPAARKQLNELLKKNAWALEIIDEATQKPRCRFDRDWSKGYALLLPEYAPMKSAGRLLYARAVCEAVDGKSTKSLEDAKKLLAMSGHNSEEPLIVGHLIGLFLCHLDYQLLAYCAFRYPDQAAYRNALIDYVHQYPPLDLRQEGSGDMFSILAQVQIDGSDKELHDLYYDRQGAKEMRRAVAIKGLFSDKPQSLIDFVKAERKRNRAYDSPDDQLKANIAAAEGDRQEALQAFPYFYFVYWHYCGGKAWELGIIDTWRAQRARSIALERAFGGAGVAKSIKTDDLISPYDGRPLEYKFDGQTLTIRVSGETSGGKPKVYKIPPDPPSNTSGSN